MTNATTAGAATESDTVYERRRSPAVLLPSGTIDEPDGSYAYAAAHALIVPRGFARARSEIDEGSAATERRRADGRHLAHDGDADGQTAAGGRAGLIHDVDFEELTIAPGSIGHVQPGQVHRFHPATCREADVVMVEAIACPDGLFCPARPKPIVPLGSNAESVLSIIRDLEIELARPESSNEIVGTLAGVLLRYVARAAEQARPTPASSRRELLDEFLDQLERHYAETRNVSGYARAIGTSTKTLARATIGQTGLAPKELVDQRVALEAKPSSTER